MSARNLTADGYLARQANTSRVWHDPDGQLRDDNGNVLLITMNSAAVTINVPADYPTIQAALASLDGKPLGSHLVTIQVADGDYTYTSAVEAGHPDGDNIQIIGNVASPAACKITFQNCEGFVAYRGNSLRLIDGFTVESDRWTSHGVWASTGHSGFRASRGGSLTVGGNVVVNKFYYGVQADGGGNLFLTTGFQCAEAGDVGVFAFDGGSIVAGTITVTLAKDTANGLGFGIMAEDGGSVYANGATCTSNSIAGIAAKSGGCVIAKTSTCNSNGAGVLADSNGVVECNGTTCSSNTNQGFLADLNGSITAGSCTASSNGQGFMARRRGFIDARNASATGNTNEGFLATICACIAAAGTTSTTNGTAYSPAANTLGNEQSYIDT
jgi:hypothetical protein